MQKKDFVRHIVILCAIAALLVFAGGIGGALIGAAHTRAHGGGAGFAGGAGELLARIAEHERRESEYLEREGARAVAEEDRIAAEDSRHRAERERYSRTADALDALWRSNRRSGGIYEEIAARLDILEDYFRGSGDQLGYDADNVGGE